MLLVGKATVVLTVLVIFASTPILSYAQQSKQSRQEPTPHKVSAPQPFNLTLGKSTTVEAKSVWIRESAEITGEGYGDAKPSYSDNDPDGVANTRIVLLDVQGLPLERLETARFGFFDNVLYLVRYEFEDGTDFDKLFLQVSSKYGLPEQEDDFITKIFNWRFASVVLSLKREFIGKHTMTFIHEPTLRGAKASNAEVYASHVMAKAQEQKGF